MQEQPHREAAPAARHYRVHGALVAARPLEPALYLVATPIGNLGDITLRALETLAGADVLACEDTRVTRVLLDRYGIATRPYAYHEHNADEVGPRLVAALDEGRSVALVSDAGTPLVSDPGYRLGQLAIEAGHRVVPIPGASAPLAALVGSGLPNDAFLFAGFLPTKDKAKRDRLREFATVPATILFFESPHRIAATVAAAAEVLGEGRRASVCRELTKLYEEVKRGTLAELAAWAAEGVRGEIAIVVGGARAREVAFPDAVTQVLELVRGGTRLKEAAAEVASQTGHSSRELYQAALAVKR